MDRFGVGAVRSGVPVAHIESTWGPIAMMLAFVVWTVRLRNRSLTERSVFRTRDEGK